MFSVFVAYSDFEYGSNYGIMNKPKVMHGATLLQYCRPLGIMSE